MIAISTGHIPIGIQTTKFIPQGAFQEKHLCDGSLTQNQRELESIQRATNETSERPVPVAVGSGTSFDGDLGVTNAAQKASHMHDDTSIQAQKNEGTNVTDRIKLGYKLPSK